MIFYVFAGLRAECFVDLFDVWTLVAGILDLDVGCDDKRAVVGHRSEGAVELATVVGQHFHRITDVFEELTSDLEGGGKAGGADFEFKVLDIAVESGFNLARDVSTGVDVDAVGRVDFDLYDIVGGNRDVDDEKIGAGNCFLDSGR